MHLAERPQVELTGEVHDLIWVGRLLSVLSAVLMTMFIWYLLS